MQPNFYKIAGITISAVSALFGIYFCVIYARSSSPDKSILLFPIFVCGLPATFFANLLGMLFLMFGSATWYAASQILVLVAYFLQWQLVAWWFYRRAAKVV